MICQVCGQRTATTHIKTLVNGQLTEAHLCAECAQKKGYSSMLSSWNGFGSLLGGLLGEVQPQEMLQHLPLPITAGDSAYSRGGSAQRKNARRLGSTGS